MPKYAAYPANQTTAVVFGWFDTDSSNYTNLPSPLLQLTDAEWTAHFVNPSGWAVLNGALVQYQAVPPAPTIAQLAEIHLAGAVPFVFTISTNLSGSYPITQTAQSNLQAQLISILKNNVFTNNQTTRIWFTSDQKPKSFTIAQFEEFARQFGVVVDALIMLTLTNTGTLPTFPVSVSV